MPETEALEITMVIAAGEAVLTTRAAVATTIVRELQAEIRLESVDFTEKE